MEKVAARFVEELQSKFGFADTAAVMNCCVRLSCSMMGDNDPGVVCSCPNDAVGDMKPYSKPRVGKLRVRCFNWASGCTVMQKKEDTGSTSSHSICSSLSWQERR